VLDFLVTSKARRRLLRLLWGRDETGSASHFAALANVGFASAYRELRAMQAQGLVVAARRGGTQAYRANHAHPMADALRAMVAGPTPPASGDADDEGRRVRAQLAALGAPLQHDPVETSSAPVEETVVRGVRLAHRDPDVARTLPVCLYRQREVLDPERLRRLAMELDAKRSLGFFLALTATLSGDRRFARWAESLRDGRWTQTPRPFFRAGFRSRREQRLAEESTPRVARRWGWRMNIDLAAFRSTFEKFVPHAAA